MSSLNPESLFLHRAVPLQPRISGGASRDGVFERVAAGGGSMLGILIGTLIPGLFLPFKSWAFPPHRSRTAPPIPILLPTFNTLRFARMYLFSSRGICWLGCVGEAFWWQEYYYTFRPLPAGNLPRGGVGSDG